MVFEKLLLIDCDIYEQVLKHFQSPQGTLIYIDFIFLDDFSEEEIQMFVTDTYSSMMTGVEFLIDAGETQ